MEVMLARKMPLSALVSPMQRLPQLCRNLRVPDPVRALDDPTVSAVVATAREQLKDKGRILVRASGTEPVVRVMCEAQSEELCHAWCDAVAAVIQAQEYRED
jgi:phosphoglucosamine mutase